LNDQYLLNTLPQSVVQLTFPFVHLPIQIGSIPEHITKLRTGDSFNEPIRIGLLPWSLQSLTLGQNFNHLITPGSLPSLTYLEFGNQYNTPLMPGSLPDNLRTLKLGYMFNQPITSDSLPSSLTSLNFGDHFNQVLPTSLPISLVELSFNYNYNNLAYGYYGIPTHGFNQIITPGTLPGGLRSLSFGPTFNQSLSPGVLPDSLTSLEMIHPFTKRSKDYFPESLRHLTILSVEQLVLIIDNLPMKMETVLFKSPYHVGDKSSKPFPRSFIGIESIILPASLQPSNMYGSRRSSKKKKIIKPPLGSPESRQINFFKEVMASMPNVRTIQLTSHSLGICRRLDNHLAISISNQTISNFHLM
ncbi:hypothetical protein SAMD00019534_086940, partial [Acytostelium subglobosum LB1]|uniref:hypothetical protein n=1 Tax=Acytostelium subglobosum LB1 TaxID=1410327 RepID=UPI0006449715